MWRKKPPAGLLKLIELVQSKFRGLNGKEALEVIVKVKNLNDGALKGLNNARFLKLAGEVVMEEVRKETERENEELEKKRKLNKTCPLCYFIFGTNQARDRHLKIVHNRNMDETIEKDETIEERNLVDAELDILIPPNDAVDVVSPVIEEIIQSVIQSAVPQSSENCPTCGKKFILKSSLDRHLEQHKQEPHLFSCDECEFKTKRKDSLLRHRRRVHKAFNINFDILRASDKENFKCKLCGKQFGTDTKSFETHIVAQVCRKREEGFDMNDEGKYKCDLCTKSYVDKAGLLRHQDWKHRPAEIFKCEDCDKSYNNQQTLKRHQRKKHGLK